MNTFEQNSLILKERYPQMTGLNSLRSVGGAGRVMEAHSEIYLKPELSKLPRAARLVFVKGLGEISTLKALVDHFDSPLTEFIVVEPTLSRMSHLLEQEKSKPWLNHPRIHWWIGRSTDEFFSDAYEYLRIPSRLFHMKAALFVEGAVLDSSEHAYFDIVADEWLACKKQRIRSLGGIDDSRVGFSNVIRNKKFIEQNPGINLLKDSFADLPAVVISTGPSLTKSLVELKGLQDRALLIAADASLKILLEAGITPHFVCCLERDEEPSAFFEGLGSVDSNLILFPLAASKVAKSYQGPQWVAYRDYGYFYYLENEVARGILSSSSSVAHMCLRVAGYLGCPEIALVGQDLAYDPVTLQSHPEGIAFPGWARAQTMDQIKITASDTKQGDVFLVEGNRGTPVPTNSTYFSFMKEFSWEASQLGKTVVNCTEGGAKIPNLRWMSLQAWGESHTKSSNLFSRIAGKRAIFKAGTLEFKEIKNFLSDFSTRWEKVVELIASLKGQELADEVRIEAFRNLRASEKQLLDDVRYITLIIQNAGREYLELVNDLEVMEVNGDNSSTSYQDSVAELYSIILRVVKPLADCF